MCINYCRLYREAFHVDIVLVYILPGAARMQTITSQIMAKCMYSLLTIGRHHVYYSIVGVLLRLLSI